MSVTMRARPENGVTPVIPPPNLPKCTCCPYGFHIDLDFLQYCENLVNSPPSDGQRIRRDRRRQRKSMEVMLGLEEIARWEHVGKLTQYPLQEAPIETDPESPSDRPANPIHFTVQNQRQTSEFVRDALEEVVDDFERTLETTTHNRRQHRTSPDAYTEPTDADACISPLKHHHRKSLTFEQDADRVSVVSNESEISASTLHNIREQMAVSLNRMRDLENQNKVIPLLQMQVSILKEEKHHLQMKLKNEESNNRHASAPLATSTLSVKPFTPQRVSPISLDKLNTKLPITADHHNMAADTNQPLMRQRPHQSLHLPPPPLKRDVGVMCNSLPYIPSTITIGTSTAQLIPTTIPVPPPPAVTTRDVGISSDHVRTRSIDANTSISCGDARDVLFTRDQLNKIVLERFATYESVKRSKLHTNATQTEERTQKLSATTQTMSPTHQTVSTATTECSHTSVGLMCKPVTRTVGSSDNTTKDVLCHKCTARKRSVGCGPDPENLAISLKSLDMPARSMSFNLDGTAEKLRILRKPAATQCTVPMTSNGVQFSPRCSDNSSQTVAVVCFNDSTDTADLLQHHNRSTNTDAVKQPERIVTHNASCNTEMHGTREYGVNTVALPRMQETGVGTDAPPPPPAVSIEDSSPQDVPPSSAGDALTPHIRVACPAGAGYCDLCRDTIRNLAKEFGRVPPAPSPDRSRIPRPTTLVSPRPDRKVMRQNTYTVFKNGSPTTTPQDTCPAEFLMRLSVLNCSTESLDRLGQNVHSSIGDELLDPDLHDYERTESEILRQVNEEERQSQLHLERLSLETSLHSTSVAEEDEEEEDDVQRVEHNGELQKSYQSYEPSRLQQPEKRKPEVAVVPRTKAQPSKEMQAALKVINDSLQKSSTTHHSLKSANTIVQKEWFLISSTDHANPHHVEDYLDCFDEYSSGLLKYMVNLIDSNGNTAMHYAVSHGNFDVVSILLDSKVCYVNQTNNAGYTCVMLVSLAKLKQAAHRTVVQRLFQMSDVNIRAKKHSQTALMLAVSHGNIEMVQMLLDAGADINIQDEDGSTALMCAAEHGRIDIVKLLLAQSDCDSTIQDMDGCTALKISLEAGYRNIGVLLYAHEHMSRNKSPYTSLRRKKSSSRNTHTPKVSPGSSPAPSIKFYSDQKGVKPSSDAAAN